MLGSVLASVPGRVRETRRVPLGMCQGLRFGLVLHPDYPPGVYLEGFGGIRIEDTVVVTATGCEVLTPTSKKLHVI